MSDPNRANRGQDARSAQQNQPSVLIAPSRVNRSQGVPSAQQSQPSVLIALNEENSVRGTKAVRTSLRRTSATAVQKQTWWRQARLEEFGEQRRTPRPFTGGARTDRGGGAGARGHSGFQGRSASGSDRREFEGNRFDKPRTARPPRREFDKPAPSREWGTEERRPPRTSERSERPKFGGSRIEASRRTAPRWPTFQARQQAERQICQ